MATLVIEIGQIWRDNDKRSKGRELKVVRLIARLNGTSLEKFAVCVSRRDSESAWVKRETEVNVRRFRNNASGYSFTGVSEVELVGAGDKER